MENTKIKINNEVSNLVEYVDTLENISSNDYRLLCQSIQTIYNINNQVDECDEREEQREEWEHEQRKREILNRIINYKSINTIKLNVKNMIETIELIGTITFFLFCKIIQTILSEKNKLKYEFSQEILYQEHQHDNFMYGINGEKETKLKSIYNFFHGDIICCMVVLLILIILCVRVHYLYFTHHIRDKLNRIEYYSLKFQENERRL